MELGRSYRVSLASFLFSIPSAAFMAAIFWTLSSRYWRKVVEVDDMVELEDVLKAEMGEHIVRSPLGDKHPFAGKKLLYQCIDHYSVSPTAFVHSPPGGSDSIDTFPDDAASLDQRAHICMSKLRNTLRDVSLKGRTWATDSYWCERGQL